MTLTIIDGLGASKVMKTTIDGGEHVSHFNMNSPVPAGTNIIGAVGIDPAANKVVVSGAQVIVTTATIANASSLSGVVDCSDGRLSRIIIPASWTTANITFQTSVDGTNFNDLYNSSGTEYTVTVGGASRAILVPLSDFLGVRYLKIRSGTTGSPVNQGGSRALTLVLVP